MNTSNGVVLVKLRSFILDVKAVILDATFDDVLPLAQARMPKVRVLDLVTTITSLLLSYY